MATRYYLTRYVQTVYNDETVYIPEFINLDASLFPWIAVDTGTGDVINLRGLVVAEVTDTQHAEIIAHPNTIEVPFFDAQGNSLGLDNTLSQINASDRTAIQNFLEARQIPTDDFIGTTTIRELLQRVTKRFALKRLLRELDISEGLDQLVADIPAQRRQDFVAFLEARGIDTQTITLQMSIRDALKIIMAQLQEQRIGLQGKRYI